MRVTDTPLVNASLDKNKLVVGSNDDRKASEHPYGSKFGSYKVVEGINPNDYLGLEVELWVDDSAEKVVWIRVHTDADDIINDVVDDVDYDGDTAVRFTMLKSGKEYDLADNVIAYMNTLRVDDNGKVKKDKERKGPAGDSIQCTDFFGRSIRAILNDDNEISFIECYKGNTWIVTEVDVDDKEIKGYYDSDSEETIDLSDNDRFIVIKDGKLASL